MPTYHTDLASHAVRLTVSADNSTWIGLQDIFKFSLIGANLQKGNK